MESGEDGGMSIGTIVMILASIMFIGYIIYKISRQREELRDTINLLTDENKDFVEGLEVMVRAGTLKPLPVLNDVS